MERRLKAFDFIRHCVRLVQRESQNKYSPSHTGGDDRDGMLHGDIRKTQTEDEVVQERVKSTGSGT